MQSYKIQIKKKSRLDLILREQISSLINIQLSNSKIRRLIMAGCVKVNDKQIRVPSFVVFENSTLEIFIDKEKVNFEKQADDVSFELTENEVLFEDDYLIFVNKPAGFPTEKTIVQDRNNLHAEVVKYLWSKNPELRNPPYVGIMHRLDKDTSGVILFTKKREVNKAISELFDSSKLDFFSNDDSKKMRKIKKTYIAKVRDSASIKNEFVVKNYLGRVTSKSSQAKWGIVSEKDGVIAVTEFYVLKRENGFCYLVCHPITGRTHQIRVHLASLGFAIVGDKIYGSITQNGKKSERLCLHAQSLEIIHPVTNDVLKIESKCPF